MTGDPFIIYALPRSRTAWLSRFLSYDGWTCHHEAAILMRDIQDVRAFFSRPRTGAAETAAAPGWHLLRHHVPRLRIAVVRRPVEDVVASMMAVNLAGAFVYDEAALRANMNRVARSLDKISALPEVLTVDYADLSKERGCAAIFEHCLPHRFSRRWWSDLKDYNIQASVMSVLNYYHAHRDAVEGFKRSCRSELRTLARSGLLKREVA